MRAPLSRAAFLAALLVGASRPSAAPDPKDCGLRTPHWVAVAIAPDARALADAVVEHLRGGLAQYRIDVCSRSMRADAPARVTLAAPAADALEIAVEVSEGTSRNRSSRVIELASLPPDSRAFTVAVALEEMLRASWATLALLSPAERPPPEARAAAEPPTPGRRVELAAFAPFEWYRGGQLHLGADLRAGIALAGPFSVGARFGARWAPPTDARHGQVRGRALLAGASVKLRLQERDRHRFDLLARADAVRVTFDPAPGPEGAGAAASATTAVAAGGLAASLALSSRLRIAAEATLGAPLWPIRAADEGAIATAVSGVALGLAVGLEAIF